jgi:hypothetical protein
VDSPPSFDLRGTLARTCEGAGGHGGGASRDNDPGNVRGSGIRWGDMGQQGSGTAYKVCVCRSKLDTKWLVVG